MPYIIARFENTSNLMASVAMQEMRSDWSLSMIEDFMRAWFLNSQDCVSERVLVGSDFQVVITGYYTDQQTAEVEFHKQQALIMNSRETWRNFCNAFNGYKNFYDKAQKAKTAVKLKKRNAARNPVMALFPDGRAFNYPHIRAFLESMGVPVSYAPVIDKFIKLNAPVKSCKYPQLNGVMVKLCEKKQVAGLE